MYFNLKVLIHLLIIVSMENVMTDVHELEKGMDLCKKEMQLRRDAKDAAILKEFLTNTEDKLRKLKSETKTAQVNIILIL